MTVIFHCRVNTTGQSLNFSMPSQTILALQDFSKPVSFVEYVEKLQQDKIKEIKANVKNSLKGLQGVGIIVSDMLPPELSKTSLHQFVYKLLLENNIKVYSHEELLQTPGKPYLYIEVNSVKSANLNVCAINCQVSLRQDVVLARDRNLKVDTVETWSSGGLAIIKPEQLSTAAVAKVGQCVVEFAKELKAL